MPKEGPAGRIACPQPAVGKRGRESIEPIVNARDTRRNTTVES